MFQKKESFFLPSKGLGGLENDKNHRWSFRNGENTEENSFEKYPHEKKMFRLFVEFFNLWRLDLKGILIFLSVFFCSNKKKGENQESKLNQFFLSSVFIKLLKFAQIQFSKFWSEISSRLSRPLTKNKTIIHFIQIETISFVTNLEISWIS